MFLMECCGCIDEVWKKSITNVSKVSGMTVLLFWSKTTKIANSCETEIIYSRAKWKKKMVQRHYKT